MLRRRLNHPYIAGASWGLISLVLIGIGASAVGFRPERSATSAGLIAYVAKVEGKYRVRVRAIDGGPSRDVAPGTRIQGWSKDGTELVFYRGRGKITDVDVVNADGSRLRRIVRVRAKGFAGLSPDRRWVAHIHGECVEKPPPLIQLRAVNGRKLHDFRAGTSGGAIDIAWSTTSQEISFINTYAGNEACRGLSPSSEVYTVPLGAPPRRVPTRDWTDALSYSPDSRRIALTDLCSADPPSCEDLLVWDRKTIRSVVPKDAAVASKPLWSPDGADLFVILSDPIGPPNYEPTHLRLVRIDASTSVAHAIAAIPLHLALLEAVSPDGSAVAILGIGNPDRLWIAPTNGGDLQRVPWPPGPGYWRYGDDAIFLR